MGHQVFGGYASDYDEQIKTAIKDLYDSKEKFPSNGKKGKIYIDTTNAKMYLWNELNSDYVEANTLNWENMASL